MSLYKSAKRSASYSGNPRLGADFGDGYIKVVQTKNDIDRIVPISSFLRRLILELKLKNNGSEYVFCSFITGEPYTNIDKAFNYVCNKAKIEDFKFHDLRHTAGTRMAASGMDIATAREILGHTDIRTTQRYFHSPPERKMEAVEALAKFGKAV